jgi:hypothetical protein
MMPGVPHSGQPVKAAAHKDAAAVHNPAGPLHFANHTLQVLAGDLAMGQDSRHIC